jgi:hypothetical protein
MKKYLSVIVVAGISLLGLSCRVGTSGTWVNDHIEPEIKSQVDLLNKQLYDDIKRQDLTELKQILSPELIKGAGKSLDSVINQVGPALKTTGSGYMTVDSYYVKNTTTNISNTVMPTISSTDDYIVNYLALNKEMYVSLLKTTGTVNSMLIIAIYGKHGDDWKLNILQMGEYEIIGKNAPGYYKDALKFYNAGDLIDAADMIIIAGQIGSPGGTYFKYKNESEMKELYSKILKEANTSYKFPITVNQIKTSPVIFGVNPQFIGEKGKEGIYPSINYKTNINLADTAALRKENDALQKNIAGIFKGIVTNNNHILYQAFDQLPGLGKKMNRFGFAQKIK